MSFSFSAGMSTVRMPPRSAASSFLLQSADRKHPAAQRHLAGHRDVAPHRDSAQRRDHRGDHADARRRTVLGHRAFGQMDVDVLAREDRRLDAIGRRARLHEAHRCLDQLLHHFAELAGGLDLALAGDRDGLDRQQLAADLGPGEPGDGADLVLFLAHSVAEFPNAEELAEILGRQLDRLGLVLEDLAQRLARDLRQLALERSDARLARVMADDRRAARRR